MPRASLKSKPYEIVSIVGRKGATNTATRYETHDDYDKAKSRAEKIAKERNVRSVYLRHLDQYGDTTKSETIKKYTEP